MGGCCSFFSRLGSEQQRAKKKYEMNIVVELGHNELGRYIRVSGRKDAQHLQVSGECVYISIAFYTLNSKHNTCVRSDTKRRKHIPGNAKYFQLKRIKFFDTAAHIQ